MIEKYKKQYKKDNGELWYDEQGKPRIEYVNYLEQRLDAGQHETIVMGLLRELAVRTHLVFPQNPKELKWFEEGTREAYDFHKRIDSCFEEQNP